MSADYDDWDDEPDYDPLWDDYREPEPTEEQIWQYEHDKYLRSLSPLGRLMHPVRDWIWRRTWRWRMKISGRWLILAGRADTSDEPPF